MELFRYTVAVALLGGMCLLAWRVTSGRWRSFAIALIVNSLVLAFLLASATAIDSWGVEPATAWGFLFLGLIAGFFVLPAVAIWPRTPQRGLRAVVSVLLVSLWLLAIHTVGIVGTVWDRWGICLPPGYEVEYVDGPESSPVQCEIGPS
jgi:hypothetical protein